MARRTTGRTKKSASARVDFSNVSKSFEAGEDYRIRCTECTLEEGQKAPYFNLKLQGVEGGEYENSVMYHKASTSESSLWRLRPVVEAFGIEIPDGPFDLDPSDFIGKEAMVSTYLDRYEGGSSIRPDEFWPIDGEDDEGGDEGGEDFDLDELSDEDVEALAEAVGGVAGKAKTVARKRSALAKMDQDELADAWAELSEGGEEEKGEEFDLDDLDDDQVKELAKHLDVKGRVASKLRAALAKMDDDEVAEAWEEISGGDEGGEGGDALTEEAVQEMNEDELEAVIETHELDVDLGDFKTLRKKKQAVLDALEEGGLLAD